MSLAVTISRDGADLVIYDHPNKGDFWVTEDGLTWPSFTMRRSYAPDSEAIGGKQLLRAVSDAGQTSLVIYAHADTTTALVALMDELEAATSQFGYDLTITLDGFTRTWPADAELPQWGQLDSGKARALMTTATITIPLNPRSA